MADILAWRKKTTRESNNAGDKGGFIRDHQNEIKYKMQNVNHNPSSLDLVKELIEKKKKSVAELANKPLNERVNELVKDVVTLRKNHREVFGIDRVMWEEKPLESMLGVYEDGFLSAKEEATQQNQQFLISRCNLGLKLLDGLRNEIKQK
jgi:predicted CopG family antitoxin